MAKGMSGQGPSNKQDKSVKPQNVNPRTGRPFRFTIKQLVAKQAAGEQLGPKQIARLQKAGKIAPSPVTPTPQLTPQQLEQRVGTATGTGVEQFMNIIGQQGAFQPGSFQNQMDAAYQNVMNQYQQTMAPEFAREQADFQQMAAERGLDPNSVAYQTLQKQLSQRQDQARQGAMQNALQAAQQVQQTGFTQALQGYQAPASMLGAFAPFYDQFGRRLTAQEEQQYLRDKMAQDAELERQRIAAGIQQARIGTSGQLTFEQQRQLEGEKYGYLAGIEAIKNPQQPLPSTGSGIASGLAAGIGKGIGDWLGGS